MQLVQTTHSPSLLYLLGLLCHLLGQQLPKKNNTFNYTTPNTSTITQTLFLFSTKPTGRPGTPSRPVGPRSPNEPWSPFSPFGPVPPVAPRCPYINWSSVNHRLIERSQRLLTASPFLPLGPCSPGGPWAPWRERKKKKKRERERQKEVEREKKEKKREEH